MEWLQPNKVQRFAICLCTGGQTAWECLWSSHYFAIHKQIPHGKHFFCNFPAIWINLTILLWYFSSLKMVWTQESYHKSVKCGCPGECSPERTVWSLGRLPLRLSKRQTMSAQTVHLRTILTRTIILRRLMVFFIVRHCGDIVERAWPPCWMIVNHVKWRLLRVH